jgi:hypothetical protein
VNLEGPPLDRERDPAGEGGAGLFEADRPDVTPRSGVVAEDRDAHDRQFMAHGIFLLTAILGRSTRGSQTAAAAHVTGTSPGSRGHKKRAQCPPRGQRLHRGKKLVRIKISEGSDYLRGLLVLSRKDRKIAVPEARMITHVGKALGYCPEFCADAIRDILGNRYIHEDPPAFGSRLLAEKFVKDGLALASSDDEVHPAEEEWLRFVVEKNRLCQAWYRQQLDRVTSGCRRASRLEVDSLAVVYC